MVDNMTKAEEDEPTEVEAAGRSSRLGLGAKLSHQSKIGPFNDPAGRKLQARLSTGERNSVKRAEEFASSAKNGCGDNEEDEEKDLESRTSKFAKKTAGPPTSSLQATKKQK